MIVREVREGWEDWKIDLKRRGGEEENRRKGGEENRRRGERERWIGKMDWKRRRKSIV